MEEKKDLLDELTQDAMLVVLLFAAACTLITFICQFFAPGVVDLFKQLSFYGYAWMIYLSLGPQVKRFSFMRIDLLVNKYPKGLVSALKVLSEIAMFIMMAVMLVVSVMAFMNALTTGAQNATVPAIPLALAYCAPVIGYALGFIAYIYKVVTGRGGNN